MHNYVFVLYLYCLAINDLLLIFQVLLVQCQHCLDYHLDVGLCYGVSHSVIIEDWDHHNCGWRCSCHLQGMHVYAPTVCIMISCFSIKCLCKGIYLSRLLLTCCTRGWNDVQMILIEQASSLHVGMRGIFQDGGRFGNFQTLISLLSYFPRPYNWLS